MNYLRKNILNALLIPAFILATLYLTGCSDSEMAKGITDAVKKSVEGEVTKKAGEIKKQFDQVIKPVTDKGRKEEGQEARRERKEKSGKD